MNPSIEAHQTISELLDHVERVVVGKRKAVKLIIVALLAGGHVLIEDIPGVGKTLMVQTIAKLIGADFKRIQFTPDLLPSDITGLSIYNQKESRFEFRPGPIMGNIILADEINRTSPKTQSALLEGMAEGHVTVDGVTRALPELFFVMATQNPIEYEGTYALPEAQLDRFLMKLSIGYPDRKHELSLLDRDSDRDPLSRLKPVLSIDHLLYLRHLTAAVFVSDAIKNYLMDLVEATRTHPSIALGISPRGTISLLRAVQAYAFVAQRDYAIPDDVKAVAPYVLAHRLLLKAEAAYEQKDAHMLIQEILASIKIPVSLKEPLQ
ncbi:AAA family ATPase [Sporolactobacillus terrae]|uniref:Magnesium chelatase n=1 Tax=Sporolactobacillus terrae TaxID=269673 RepID=A0A410DAK6_9BACL|nr:MoxR family ATPase [Sporolactobacillus terrae]QAA23132.1 MoxR family ATPase [Sporolactobacillus terrae]QAA26102.1 MoxR family ATPase [Sporolactobacillus terrae]UAK15196.1 MoxR family ATPase [Sporolactobacillus terrae]BBN99549.1 magnesium chelatase [Sporolactobacillus terrae]